MVVRNVYKLFRTSRSFQTWALLGTAGIGALCLGTIEQFPLALYLLLGSLLLLYYTSFPAKTKWGIGAVLTIIILPLAAGGTGSESSYMNLATQICIYAIMALGLNVTVGFTGLLDFGYIAFFAIGAYTYAILASPQLKQLLPNTDVDPFSGSSFWFIVFLGAGLAFIAGLVVGLPVLRVRGDYLTMITLAFAEALRIFLENLSTPINITNGSKGIPLISYPNLFGIDLKDYNQLYFVALALLALALFIILRLEKSRIGRAWKSIRENEIAAQAMGVPIVRMKLLAFAIGSAFAGCAGVMLAAKDTFVDPTNFILMETIIVLAMVIVGGMGSVPGVILGAAVVGIVNLGLLVDLTQFLETRFNFDPQYSPEKMQKAFFGVLLICIMRFRPQGLIPAKNHFYPPPVSMATQPQGVAYPQDNPSSESDDS
ncbi:branched-chain amino acid ABC transporter permease [Pasteuria penetrans]|uniref:branched-chain amino acid ABC transporter permease n=1 Tax=Pasteuria penetrans TaxID=86005 RepID=UPI000F997018|nr:branched-chain amino acid ABC transporter permease [Pasteuria penetrans]